MRRNKTPLSLILLTVSFLFLISCDGGSNFKGSVHDESGKPISGAKLVFRTSSGRVAREETTENDGSFSTSFLHSPFASERITVTVSKEGYKTYEQKVPPGVYSNFEVVLSRDAAPKSN